MDCIFNIYIIYSTGKASWGIKNWLMKGCVVAKKIVSHCPKKVMQDNLINFIFKKYGI